MIKGVICFWLTMEWTTYSINYIKGLSWYLCFPLLFEINLLTLNCFLNYWSVTFASSLHSLHWYPSISIGFIFTVLGCFSQRIFHFWHLRWHSKKGRCCFSLSGHIAIELDVHHIVAWWTWCCVLGSCCLLLQKWSAFDYRIC